MSTATAKAGSDATESEVVGRLVWEAIHNQHFNYDRELGLKRLGHLAELYPIFKHIVWGPTPDDVRAAILEADEADKEHGMALRRADRRRLAVEALKDHPDYLAAFLAVEASSATTGGTKAKAKTTTKAKAKPKRKTGPEYLDDRESARIAWKAASGIALSDDTVRRLDPDWQEAYLAVIDDGPEGFEGWLRRIRDVTPDRAEEIELALAEAKADPGEDEPEPDQAEETSEPAEDWIEAGEIATLADVEAELGSAQFLWDLWIQFGAIAAVIAEGGTGKTRTVLEWAARLWFGHAMPDGSPNPLPAGTKTLWLCYDRNWRGLIKTAREFGLPVEAVILPTHRKKPLFIPDFDDPQTIALLGAIIRKHRPGFVAIDTTTYATAFNTAKANETKMAFDPLMNLMCETRTACIALTHTNAQGEILNRRLRERVRTEIKISRPDPDQKDRLRLEVRKTEDKKPEALGMTFRDDRIDYDDKPPSEPEAAHRGPKPEKTTGLAAWLWDYLQLQPAPIVEIVDAARDAGKLAVPTAKNPKPSISSLYDAKGRIPRLHPGKDIEEFEMPTDKGKRLKHWRIADAITNPDGTVDEDKVWNRPV